MEADASYCISKIGKKINTERRYCDTMRWLAGYVVEGIT